MNLKQVIDFFFDNYVVIFEIAYFTVMVIMTLYNLFRGKNIKKDLKELENFMKYRTSSIPIETASQSFSTTKDKFEYDPATGKLVKVGEIDLVELVRSSVQDCMSEYLRLYMEQENEASAQDIANRYRRSRSDLSVIGEAFEIIAEYRELHNLDPQKVSDSEVFDMYEQDSLKLYQAYQDKINKKEVDADNEEKKDVVSSQSSSVSEVREEDSQKESETN